MKYTATRTVVVDLSGVLTPVESSSECPLIDSLNLDRASDLNETWKHKYMLILIADQYLLRIKNSFRIVC